MSRVYNALLQSPSEQDRALTARPSGRDYQSYRPPVAPGPEPAESLDPHRLVWVLRRRKWQILLVAILVVIPAALLTFLAEPLYRSSAMVQIDPEPVQVLPYREIDVPAIAPNFEMFMKSQEQVLRGPSLVSRIGERLKAVGDDGATASEVPFLWDRFSIQRIENTQIFRLSYVAPRPEVAAKVANLFAEEYIKLHFESRQETREKARQMLQRELDGLEQRVQLSEKELVKYAQQNRIQSGDSSQGLVQQKRVILGQQLAEAEGEAYVARSRLDSLRKASVNDFPERLVNSVIAGLVPKVLQLEHELTALRASFGENWPAVVQKRSEMALLRDQLEREKLAALSQAREQAQLDYGAAESKRRLLMGSMEEQSQLANQLQTASIQYNIIRREVETNQKMYEGLLERLKQTSVTPGMEFGGFHVIEPAMPSSEVDSPKVLWNLLLATILGLALGVCFAFVRDYWDSTVSTVEEVEHLTVLPILGTVPLVGTIKPPRGLLTLGRTKAAALSGEPGEGSNLPQVLREGPVAPLLGRLAANPAAADAVRNVCASILLSQSGSPPRVIAVTSAVPGEGKTTLVSELGQAFADGGAKTLLVECDLRRPRFGTAFGVGPEGGLSLYLAGHAGAAPAIHPTSNGNLFVVAAGPSTPNPPALLNSDKMRAFLREMTARFQFVILDSPPLIPMADARVVAAMSEGVVLVVRAGYVPRPLVRRMCSMLESTGATVLGAVLNGTDPQGPESPYYRYYKHHYESEQAG